MGNFIATGRIVISNNRRSYKIYAFTEEGKAVFIGLVSRKELSRLLRGEITVGSICKYAETPRSAKVAQEPLDFSVRLADPTKLGKGLNNVT